MWTYDIYQPLINKRAKDEHYVAVGRWATVLGVVISIGAAYTVMRAQGIMDYVQALFSFFIAPLLGAVLTGMFWKRATKAGGFWGLLIGTVTSISLWAWVKVDPAALRYVALSPDAKDMAENMYRALWCFLVTVIVTFIVSMVTTPKTDVELNGLVYGATTIPQEPLVPWYKNEWADSAGHRHVFGLEHLFLVGVAMGKEIPIWFFIGVLLIVYGVLILGYGSYELTTGSYGRMWCCPIFMRPSGGEPLCWRWDSSMHCAFDQAKNSDL